MPDTPSVTWNDAALDVIRRERPEPVAAARVLYALHAALFRTWVAHDPPPGPRTGDTWRDAERHDAMACAAWTVLCAAFPAHTPAFTRRLEAAGLSRPTRVPEPGSPAAAGRLADSASGGPDDTLFALRRPLHGQFAPPVPWGTPEYLEQVREVLAYSAGLTAQQQAAAHYWADGPGGEGVPGLWTALAAHVSRRDAHAPDQDVKMYLVLTGALLDASAACWAAKAWYGAVRPQSAVRALLGGRIVRGWDRAAHGDAAFPADRWQPYVAAPPWPGYPSTHSTLSAAAAQVLCMWTGSDVFGAGATVTARTTLGQPPLRLSWATFTDAADEAGLSRRYAGVQFRDGDLAGRAAGRQIGRLAFQHAQRLVHPGLRPAP
ncbi:vanadium-dependent haloperoxidase [uncultured Deinococcus sp.]|uniref:vanadium-dependent haloperoxidase n=1 Tax=uncultured Deinococcus sp. TaxID=158789 RepID=UPI002600A649|nr:vanadium-dependent haloperoxidase [uncultured Deinococcus sp.]